MKISSIIFLTTMRINNHSFFFFFLQPFPLRLVYSRLSHCQNIPFSDSTRNIGFILNTKMSMNEEGHHITVKSWSKCLFQAQRYYYFNPQGFLPKMQPKLLLVPICILSYSIYIWVHPVVLSILSIKFTLLQDSFSWHPITTNHSFSWHPITTNLHLSQKSWKSFPFRSRLIKNSGWHYMLQCNKQFWFRLPL